MYSHYYIVNKEMTQMLLFDLYEAWNKPEEVEKWQAKLLQREAAIE
jgi:hypothetical protein